MTGRTVLATLGGRGPSQRLQVSLVHAEEGGLLIDLREQHYAEGIGWFDQRRLEIDPRQYQQLQAVLGLKSDWLVGCSGRACHHTFPRAGDRGLTTTCRRRSALIADASVSLVPRSLRIRGGARCRGRDAHGYPTLCRLVALFAAIASSRFFNSFSRWSTPSCSSVQISSRVTRRPTSFSPQSSSASV